MGFIRLLLAVSVVLEHSYGHPLLLTAESAVMIFFVISGFYMNLVIHEKYAREPGWRRRFIFNRFLRLYPTYLAALILFCTLAAVVDANNIFINPLPERHDGPIWLFKLLNISVIGQDIADWFIPNFDDIYNHPISPAWTLASEFPFYLAICALPMRRTIRISLLAVAFVAALAMRYSFCPLGGHCDRLPSNTIVFFLAGALSYYAYEAMRDCSAVKWPARAALIATLAALFSPAVSPAARLAFSGWSENAYTIALYAWFAFSLPLLFMAAKRSKIDRIIGDLSFPVYITQMIGIFFGEWAFERWHLGQQTPRLLMVAILSLSAYLLIEIPVDRLRQRVARAKTVSSAPAPNFQRAG